MVIERRPTAIPNFRSDPVMLSADANERHPYSWWGRPATQIAPWKEMEPDRLTLPHTNISTRYNGEQAAGAQTVKPLGSCNRRRRAARPEGTVKKHRCRHGGSTAMPRGRRGLENGSAPALRCTERAGKKPPESLA